MSYRKQAGKRPQKGNERSRWLIGISFSLAAIAVLWLAAPLIARGDYDEACRLAGEGCKPGLVSDHLKAIADVRDVILKTFAGIGAAVGIFVSWVSLIQARDASHAAQVQGTEARTSENFSKAVEQIGNADAVTRAGGLYALGRILRTAEPDNDYWPIMDLLGAYVRKNRGLGRPAKVPASGRVPEDIQAALTVLCRRGEASVPQRNDGDAPIDLSHCLLQESFLDRGNFQCSYLQSTQLSGASARKLDLYRAYGPALDATNTVFEGASLCEAIFPGADLRGADLRGANLSGADLAGADLRGANLQGADLRRRIVKENGTERLVGNLAGVQFEGADLTDAHMCSVAGDSEYVDALLTQAQLDKTKGSKTTALPQPLTAPGCWS